MRGVHGNFWFGKGICIAFIAPAVSADANASIRFPRQVSTMVTPRRRVRSIDTAAACHRRRVIKISSQKWLLVWRWLGHLLHQRPLQHHLFNMQGYQFWCGKCSDGLRIDGSLRFGVGIETFSSGGELRICVFESQGECMYINTFTYGNILTCYNLDCTKCGYLDFAMY